MSFHRPCCYRYYAEGFYDIIAIVAGCVQTILYCDFFYLYITKVSNAFFDDIIAIVSGCVQTILYCDFFYLYIAKVSNAFFYDIIAIVAGCVQTILYCNFFYLYNLHHQGIDSTGTEVLK